MRHLAVLINETILGLNLIPGAKVVDGTLGDGGHSEAILDRVPESQVLGIDADIEAILRTKRYLYRFEDRIQFVHDNFANLLQVIKENNFGPVSGIVLDLGWSSPQFEERGRGFSFQQNEPLDMRYNAVAKNLETAAEIVNTYLEKDLAKLFKTFGEEKFSKEIAEAICRERRKKPIENTRELVEIILQTYREKLKTDKDIPWIGGLHPATKVFQALRMEVNHELEVLKQVLPQALEVLAPGGRLAVISFHSLEDRIVKRFFETAGISGHKIITKKPIIATDQEIQANPRSRSAKLRILEK